MRGLTLPRPQSKVINLRITSPSGGSSAGRALRLFAGVAAASLMAGAAHAQTPAPVAPNPEDETEVEELVVVAGVARLRGSVVGDITPEVTLSPREIRAYGAASVSELLTALAPQIGSGQGSGRPVVLINGARASGFAEIRDLPTEAISRMEILPEEVALKYGYPAEQKVVNIVLRQRFRATLAEASAMSPTEDGGGQTFGGHGAMLRIQRGQRLTLDAKANVSEPILEGDRDVIGGERDFRSLQPESRDVALNAVYARPIGDSGVAATVNGLFELSESENRLGLSPFGTEALLRQSDSTNASLAAALSGAYAGWQWSYTGEISRNVSESFTDRTSDVLAYTDTTRSTTTAAKSDIVLNRALWELPAGRVSTTLTGRVSTTELESKALRAGLRQSSDLTRSIGQLQGNFDVPITREGEGFGETIGKLSANFNLNYQHLSDFGDLTAVGGGLNWTPVKPLRVLASFTRADQAPTMNQLGDPVTATPGVRVFDFTTGETVDVIRVTGGSRDLEAGRKDTFKLGLTYRPFEETDLVFQANYVSTRTRDAVAAFPSASTQVEAAFPERFIRDASGALVQVDARPVNFARQARDELRWGFTYSRPVGPQPTPEQRAAFRRRAEGGEGPPREGAPPLGATTQSPGQTSGAQAPAQGPPPAEGAQPQRRSEGGERGPGMGPGGGFRGPGGGGRGGRGGFGGFGGGGPRGGVFQVGLYHTVAFRDDVLIRPGLPELDLLDGGALGGGGGSPRHEVNLQTNYTRRGLGVSMNAKWESGTKVVGGPTSEDLEFSDLTTVNLRLFADLGAQPWAREHQWLRGMRATLSVNNLFDERQEVRTADGVIPISYQPDLLDPVGRSVKLTVRKLFF